jgi:molybdopterin converting factor small subunit
MLGIDVLLRVRRRIISWWRESKNMPVLKLPTPLHPYVNGHKEVPVNGRNVAEAMESFLEQYPALRPHLTNTRGELRPFVNLFIGENNIRDLQGLKTPLNNDDQLILIPSIAGG